MGLNNNQNVGLESAAARLSKLPVVRSACVRLSAVYAVTKRSHPSLASVCGALESSVTALSAAACNTVSPVIGKLEPHISIANSLACKSLDWLEDSFPVLLSPSEQIVATAQNKMHEIQDAVQHTVMWVVMGTRRHNEGASRSIVERAISVADVGLDSALSLSEALVDQVLPPAEEDEGEEKTAHMVEGFEVAQVKRRYPERIATLYIKLCKRTYRIVGSKVQAAQDLSTTCLTLIWRLQELPQYLQHLAVSGFFFIIQMYQWSFSPFQHVRSPPNALIPPLTDVVRVHPQAVTARRMKRQQKMFVLDNKCKVDGCV